MYRATLPPKHDETIILWIHWLTLKKTLPIMFFVCISLNFANESVVPYTLGRGHRDAHETVAPKSGCSKETSSVFPLSSGLTNMYSGRDSIERSGIYSKKSQLLLNSHCRSCINQNQPTKLPSLKYRNFPPSNFCRINFLNLTIINNWSPESLKATINNTFWRQRKGR